MATPPAEQLLSLLREVRNLERRRTAEGITPLEYQRLRDLRQRLARKLAPGALGEDPEKDRTTRIVVEFRNPASLNRARIRNLARGGLFVPTPFPPDLGTQLELRVRVTSTGDDLMLPCEVVTNHVGDGFTTQDLGMGVQLKPLDPVVKRELEKLFVAGGGPPLADRSASEDAPGS
jgi:Tfp pilus assembly protein PilZ